MSTKNGQVVWQLIDELKDKSGVTELTINHPQKVFVERDSRFIQLDIKFKEEDVQNFINEVLEFNKKKQKIASSQLLFNGTLPGGSRINIVHPPLVSSFPAISIRFFNLQIKKFDESPEIFSLGPFWIEFLKAIIKSRLNLIVCGGTGSGKTTLLNMLLSEIPNSERLITIEDTRELQVSLSNIIHLETWENESTKVTARDLVKNPLRMRPDRIVLGEIRGAEIFDLLQAMNTGHSGSMSSVHSNSTTECLTRLNSLFMLAGLDIPLRVARSQIASALQFIIGVGKNKEGKRVISEILEITGMENDTILSQKIAEYKKDQLLFTGITPSCMKTLEKAGLSLDYFKNAKQD